MSVPASFTKKIEIKYLRILAQHFKKGKIDVKTAKASTKLFLTFLPFKSYEDMRTKFKILTDTYPAFSEVYLYLLQQIEEAETQEVLEKMRKFMKNKDVDSAINVINK
jgi:hypothetical protein